MSMLFRLNNFEKMSLKSSIGDFFRFDELKDNFIKLIEAKFELKKLEIQEKLENLITDLIVKIAVGISLFMAFIMGNILLAVGLNILLDSNWYGFGIVFVMYLIISFIVFINRNALLDQVRKKVNEKVQSSGF